MLGMETNISVMTDFVFLNHLGQPEFHYILKCRDMFLSRTHSYYKQFCSWSTLLSWVVCMFFFRPLGSRQVVHVQLAAAQNSVDDWNISGLLAQEKLVLH